MQSIAFQSELCPALPAGVSPEILSPSTLRETAQAGECLEEVPAD
jgi:hypothetical protein